MSRASEARPGIHPEIELEPATRVIGDLHLDVDCEQQVAGFVEWLRALGPCPRLVILGDLFEYWIGAAQGQSSAGQRALQALRECVERGTAIDVVPGNRDFLLDRSFESATGACVRERGFIGVAAGVRTLFIHGDELCTLDVNYQRLRRVLRARPTRFLAAHLPLFASKALARRLRRASTRALSSKPSAEAEQQSEAAGEQARVAGASVLVCGHAHRFRDEALAAGVRWFVVDAFGGQRDMLSLDASGAWAAGASGATQVEVD